MNMGPQHAFRAREAHGGTFLTLEHAGIGEAAGDSAQMLFAALDAGWDEHFARLRANAHGA